jgi:hypothetical protein
MKGADFVWDKDKLDRFIAKPDEVVPGNNMKPYGGLASAEDRAKVIEFLESPPHQLSDYSATTGLTLDRDGAESVRVMKSNQTERTGERLDRPLADRPD